MPRLPRSAQPAYGKWHITARGVNRCLIYRDAYDYRVFEVRLRLLMQEAGLKIYVYCLMPNHFHVVVEGPMEAISRVMHRLNGIHAQSFNDRYDRSGHLFQARFHSVPIKDDEHLRNACAYVLRNPVRAGLCAEARDWPWSAELVSPPASSSCAVADQAAPPERALTEEACPAATAARCAWRRLPVPAAPAWRHPRHRPHVHGHLPGPGARQRGP